MTPPQPLAGLRVVEVAQNLAGPFCARILGEFGADVIKVEPPAGDAARHWGPPFLDGQGTIFAFANTGKRSVCLDLSTEEGLAALAAMVADADVLIESLRPGVLTELGMGWEAARALNPRLVYTSVLAYGEDGPLRESPGYEPLMQAHGGLMSYTGEVGGPPVRVGTSVVDMGTGMWAALGVMAALRERDRTGEGVRISGALFDTALTLSAYHILGALTDGTVAGRFGTQLPMIAPYGTFPTRDGEIMVAVGTDRLFVRLCSALELGPLHQVAQFRSNPGRVANRDELNATVSEATGRHTSDELLALLRNAGVPCAPVLDVGQIVSDAQFQATGLLSESPLNTRLPLRWNGERFTVGAAPPDVGAHTGEVLRELGLEAPVLRALLGETEA